VIRLEKLGANSRDATVACTKEIQLSEFSRLKCEINRRSASPQRSAFGNLREQKKAFSSLAAAAINQ